MACSTQSPLPPGRVEVGVEVEYPLPVGPVLVNSWSLKPQELKLSNYLALEHPLPPSNSASTIWRIRQTLIDQGLQHDVPEEILALCPIPILHECKRSWEKRVAIFRQELRKNLWNPFSLCLQEAQTFCLVFISGCCHSNHYSNCRESLGIGLKAAMVFCFLVSTQVMCLMCDVSCTVWRTAKVCGKCWAQLVFA